MARIQAALGLIGFSSTSNAPSTTPRVLSVVLTDAASGASVVRTRTVGVTAVNDVPVVTLPSTTIAYAENAAHCWCLPVRLQLILIWQVLPPPLRL